MVLPSFPIRVANPLPPVVSDETRLLILGSLPGAASLKAERYYAHPQNGFWRLVGSVIGRDVAGLAYEQRLEVLKAAGLGLWDVIASAYRPGSLDAAIREAESADLNQLVGQLPRLRAIAFNGATAARLGRRELLPASGLTLIDLPSSSPAHTRPFASKTEAWSVLKAFVAKS